MISARHTFGARLWSTTTIAVLVMLVSVVSCHYTPHSKRDKRDQRIALLLVAAYFANPCNFVGIPTMETVQASSSLPGYGYVKGRVVQRNGEPVISALVIMDEVLAAGGASFWGTHTTMNRDGTFIFAGVPTGAGNYLVSIEPVYSDFYQRIETHVDCYMKPKAFTAGYFVSGGSLTTTRLSGTQFAGPGTGATVDLGTTTILE